MFNSYQETTLHYDQSRCINCGFCSSVCPHGVFLSGSEAAVLAKPESCMECGACALNCPVKAIHVQSGVGCAHAMIRAALTGSGVESCGCGGDEGDCCGK
ncbi:MAG: mercury methylation ferredoxin HgcB [Methanomicrobiales archaeon]|nr:mercury methylation ferredoxin HgcB [Methanomicrobiales archaeon]